jgi:hypothetical protein
MQRPRIATSLIVRVIERRDGTRIQVHAIGTREVQEFATWEAALAFVRRLSEERGLR